MSSGSASTTPASTGRSATAAPRPCTVARYLARRLHQLGITHLFGVPGNHLGPFLEALRAEGHIEWVGTPTEGGAGQAADAYARVHGAGAAAVTYSVGAFNLLNACGGAYAENVPLIAINASPPYEQWQNFRAIGLITSHMSQRPESNLEVYRQVTVDAQCVSNPGLAPGQIDRALTACLSERRPVYLEVMEDLWDAPCPEPVGEITARPRPFTEKNQHMLDAAVQAVLQLIDDHPAEDGRPRPILWAGEEIDRFGLGGPLLDLVDATGIPFCTTIGAKAVVSEHHPRYHGVYNGDASDPVVHKVFKQWSTCRIGLGAWSTSKNLQGDRYIGTDWVMASHGGISVGTAYFPDVQLAQLIPALRDVLVARYGPGGLAADYYAEAGAAGRAVPGGLAAFRATLSTAGPLAPLTEHLTYDGLFTRINHFLNDETQERWTVISDAAFSLIGSMNLTLPAGGYLAQNIWLSIGWSVGAAAGAALAPERRNTRPMVFVGDGSFQETCQEVSTHTRLGLPSVIFVLNNQNFYGIEQMLVAPCYYSDNHPPGSDGADFYNELHPWKYHKLAEVFSGTKTPATGLTVTTARQLDDLLTALADPTDPVNAGPLLVHVRLDRHDYPRALSYKVARCP
ncbi:alpha-keto acid decarboxylase family protein [Streptomyces sp. PRKS01-65]|nr:thiamine pyrophosphate-binding protein [Streptomyces harenosi]NEY30668.1 alpha-keto acid decarboxylase family protein [Streptomyces harenosi]